jgi:hypothetical protein
MEPCAVKTWLAFQKAVCYFLFLVLPAAYLTKGQPIEAHDAAGL